MKQCVEDFADGLQGQPKPLCTESKQLVEEFLATATAAVAAHSGQATAAATKLVADSLEVLDQTLRAVPDPVTNEAAFLDQLGGIVKAPAKGPKAQKSQAVPATAQNIVQQQKVLEHHLQDARARQLPVAKQTVEAADAKVAEAKVVVSTYAALCVRSLFLPTLALPLLVLWTFRAVLSPVMPPPFPAPRGSDATSKEQPVTWLPFFSVSA